MGLLVGGLSVAVSDRAWHRVMPRLGLTSEEQSTILRWRDAVLAAPGDVARLVELRERLLMRIGRFGGVVHSSSVFSPADAQHRLGRGVLPLLALISTAADVHEAHLRRDVDPEVSWRTLSDLSRQTASCRQAYGEFGLHQQWWLSVIWADGYLWLGRLQFEISAAKSPELLGETVLNVHIPATGPLNPQAVDSALAAAPEIMGRSYPQTRGVRWLECHSWLLDPQLTELLPGSRLAHFQQRWRPTASTDSDRDGLYFGFGVEPDDGWADPAARIVDLPGDSSLRRALIEIWRRGDHPRVVTGLVRVPTRADDDTATLKDAAG